MKFKELSEETKKDVLKVIASQLNFLADSNVATPEDPDVLEIAQDYEYGMIGTKYTDWVFV